ncbi:MAG: hypothetical protein AAFO98_00670, partial [Pseudomonadota bacterium]
GTQRGWIESTGFQAKQGTYCVPDKPLRITFSPVSVTAWIGTVFFEGLENGAEGSVSICIIGDFQCLSDRA